MTCHRVGLGVDAHRFTRRRPLVLCGHELPGEPGLEGHSDGDVALHAVTDALLGAIAAGDIGELFPSSDERWRDADSAVFVRSALELARDAGWRPVNCDLTLIGGRPRIAPSRDAMRGHLAELLGVDPARVSVKATTTDGMGLAGRGEGLAAIAVVLVAAGGGRDE